MAMEVFLIAWTIVIELARYAIPIIAVCAVLMPLVVWSEVHGRVAVPARARAEVAHRRHRAHRPHLRHRLV